MSSYPEQTSLSDLLSKLKTLKLNQASRNLDNLENIDFQDTFNIVKEESDFEFNEAELLFVLDFTNKFDYLLHKSNIITGETRKISLEVEKIINYQFNNFKFVEHSVKLSQQKPCCSATVTTGCIEYDKLKKAILEALESNHLNSLSELLKPKIEEAFSEENKISEAQWKSYRSTMESIWEDKGI